MMKSFPAAQVKRGLRVGWAADEIDILAGVRVDAHLPKCVPGRHGAGVVVSGQAVGAGVVTRGNDRAYVLGSLVGATSPVIKIGSQKARLVAHVVAAWDSEESVETVDKRLWAAGLLRSAKLHPGEQRWSRSRSYPS
jgi:hypothetical protein